MKVLTDAHKAAMQAGRKTRSSFSMDGLTEQQVETLKRLSHHAPSAVRVLERAYRGKLGAIPKAKCQECVNYDDMQARIRECPISICPVWSRRPYQNKK